MKCKNEMFDLYTDYLLASFGHASATSLSSMTDGKISHDKVTRFLRFSDFNSKQLWKFAKPFVREIEKRDGIIIIDDSIAPKPFTDQNEIVTYHWDHIKKRSVKGINFLSALYLSGDVSVPVAYELVRKPQLTVDKKTGIERRKGDRGKHEIMRDLLKSCVHNQVKFGLILADSWYSSSETMEYIKNDLKKNFIICLKSNRSVALTKRDKREGRWVRVDSIKLKRGEVMTVHLKKVDFPLKLARIVFKHENRRTGYLYLVSSKSTATYDYISTSYKKRWKVEEYHKSLKYNASLAKSPTKIVRTQANHLFAALCAFVKLEKIKNNFRMNHFAIKSKLYLNAIRSSHKHLISEFSV